MIQKQPVRQGYKIVKFKPYRPIINRRYNLINVPKSLRVLDMINKVTLRNTIREGLEGDFIFEWHCAWGYLEWNHDLQQLISNLVWDGSRRWAWSRT